MRKLILGVLAVLPLLVQAAPTKTVTLAVQNMTCAVCPITVKKSLARVPGVSDVRVEYDSQTATVSYDPDQASLEDLTRATANAGYPSSPKP